MGRFSQMAKGVLARHVVDLPLPNGDIDKVAVRPLNDDDDEQIDTQALAYAKRLGVAEPKAGDPIYDRAVRLYTLLLSCSDPQSPDAEPAPYFESVEEIRKGLDGDRIAWLITAQQVWQDQCSPRKLRLTGDEVFRHIVEIATSEDERPFVRLRPGLQWILLRTLASLAVASPDLKSVFSSDSVWSATASPKASN